MDFRHERWPRATREPRRSRSPRWPSPGQAPAPSAGVSRAALIWIGVAVVLLSFVAAFLGSWLARSAEAAAEPTPTATPSPLESEMTNADYEEALEEILPAGAAVRAGTGVPAEGKGYEGEVYIDIATSDVYLFRDGAWVQVGNIRQSAAENLTGETGASGCEQSVPARPGRRARPAKRGRLVRAGAAGTQIVLEGRHPRARRGRARRGRHLHRHETLAVLGLRRPRRGSSSARRPPPAPSRALRRPRSRTADANRGRASSDG